MRVPLSWLREYADVPAGEPARDVAARLIRAGLEVETVDEAGADVVGPLVVGQVLEFTEETHKNGKTVRWCAVDVGPEHNIDRTAEGAASPSRGIVCGARNFAVGDLVVVVLPGAVLPGGFAISARKTYGHVSDGMICSARELGIGDDHDGIIVLERGEAALGDDAVALLHLRDDVLDIAVTPDRGYCLSIRGVAREAATAYGVPFRDPAAADGTDTEPAEQLGGHPVKVEDGARCPVFVTRTVTGFDPFAPSPRWLQRRVQLAGMRPISLAVDVTNYVMLELGQPLHAFDAAKLDGDLVVRRATEDEKLTTLDGACRELDADDMVICDTTGPVSLAAVMGGESTEVGLQTTSLLLEAATWDPASVARSARRHKLPSEAARRFERGVDPALPPVAAELAATLLTRYGGGEVQPGRTHVGTLMRPTPVTMPIDLPDRVAGRRYENGATVRRLTQIGCAVEVGGTNGTTTVTVVPPSWRPDLAQPADLVEEVLRLEGYDTIPSELPPAPPGR
ncbi:MAG: phenylalanine--tRNA ligase subunit beta, partial [Jiangellaceae bacterium]